MSPAALANIEVFLDVKKDETEKEKEKEREEEKEKDAAAGVGNKGPPKKKIRKVKTGRMVLDDESFSPIVDELVFDNLEIQTMYNGFNEKTKKNIAKIPVRDQKKLVTNTWQKKQENKEKK
jgi:hypothetical protein